MPSATLTKNGMIHLPQEIRRKLKLKPGDKINFVDIGDEIIITPTVNLFDLVNPDEKDVAIEIIHELKKEHLNEK